MLAIDQGEPAPQLRDVRRSEQPVLNTISRELAARGWSDADLAIRTGLERSRLNRLKNGRADPRIGEALRIAIALDLPIECVFSLNPGYRFDDPED